MQTTDKYRFIYMAQILLYLKQYTMEVDFEQSTNISNKTTCYGLGISPRFFAGWMLGYY